MDLSLLSSICETPGAPGFEHRIRQHVLDQLSGLDVEVSIDNLGNVTALKKGLSDKRKAMCAAHMDEIGFIITHIDDNGFLRFHTLGGFDPKTLTAQRVIVHGKKDVIGVMGSKPIHIMSPEERNKPPKIKDYFIDIGLNKEQAEEIVAIGNPVTRERSMIEMGEYVNCKSIDNRVSVFILLETLKNLEEPPYDFYGVFTVQEEVGLRGAHVAAQEIQPDFGFGLDTTIAYDTPGAPAHERVTELGKGTAIKIMDARTICDSRMVSFMKETADKAGITWQPEILTAGGTDTASLQREVPGGSIAGAISIPTRNIHSVIEMASKSDIQGSIDLLTACVNGLDSYDWNW